MLQASNTEIERISDVISAAQNNSWEKFKSLSDEPFLNEETMMEQFEESSIILRDMNHQWDLKVSISQDPTGPRILFSQIMAQSVDQPLILILHSTTAAEDSRISIWAFYQNIDFS